MTEYPLFPRDVCSDQWWPDVDDYPADDCTDQRHPPAMPDVMSWDRLGSNPVMDVINTFKQMAEQAGIYMIHAGAIYGKSRHASKPSDHNPDPVTVTYNGQTLAGKGFSFDYQIIDEISSWKFEDPTVETPQTRADILAYRRNRNTGPSTEKFTKRGKKKK